MAAEDPFGNVVTTFNGTVTATLANGPGGAAHAGTTTSTAVNGLATFQGLALDNAGVDNGLEVSAGGLSSNGVAPISVIPGPATRLVMIVQPSGSVIRNHPFAVGVEALDAFGNVATGFGGTVTATLSANPNHNKLAGTLSVQAINGQAVITDATLKKTGKSYVITLTSSGLTPAATSAFNVSNGAPGKLTLARRAMGRRHVGHGSSLAHPPRPPHRTSTPRLAAPHRGKR